MKRKIKVKDDFIERDIAVAKKNIEKASFWMKTNDGADVKVVLEDRAILELDKVEFNLLKEVL